jgi:C_GCAxxG_C_C family probable redox protein
VTRRERALDLFRNQFTCSQAVFAAYRQEDELSEEAALRLATVFGAGVAGSGRSICGAVTGALMAISMKHGRGHLDTADAKSRTYALARTFLEEFERVNGSSVCETMLGLNLAVPGNIEKAREMKLFETTCAGAVACAADILDRIL